MISVAAIVSHVALVSSQSTAHQTAAWYRGAPSGVPRTRDLAFLQAHGFSAIAWPSDVPRSSDLADVLAVARLRLIVAPPDIPLSCDTARRGQPELVTVDVRPAFQQTARAIAWRAVAHGARVVSFDPGAAYRYADVSGTAPWLAAAQELARQFRVNAAMFQTLAAGPALRAPAEAAPSLDVVLLQTPRSWVLVATNCGTAHVRSAIQLPPEVPAALWTGLLDGSGMSMRNTPAGPDWTVELTGGEVAVYLIEKAGGSTGFPP